MAYKFQLGAYTASGSLVQEGAVEVDALTADSMNLQSGGITNAGSVAGATSIDGSGDLTMGTITMTGFSVDADGDTALKSLAVDNSSTIGCDADADIMTLAAQSLALASDVDFNIAKAGGLQLGGVAMTATAAELNLLDNVSGLVQADFTKLAAVDASAVELNYIDGFADAAYDESADSVVFFDATDSKLKHEAANDFSTRLASDGLKSVSGRMELDVNGLGAAKTTLAQADLLAIADSAGSDVSKKITFSNLEDQIFGNISGDATIAAGGALTIANDAVEQAMIADDAVGADQLAANAVVNASIASNAAIDMDKLDGGSLAASLSDLAQGDLMYAGDVDDSNNIKSITFSDLEDAIFGNVSGDATLAAGGALTLAAAQTNVTSIINSSLAKIGTDAAQEYIDFGTSNEIKFAVNNALVATVEAGKLVVNGDLEVKGTTTSIDSTTINISSSFTFEGPADAHETILTCGSPSADATLELFQGAAGTYYMPAFSDSNIKTTVIAATAAEINLMDGGTARGTSALADGDGFMHNDNGTMKQTNVLKMFEYTVAKISGDATVADTGALTIAADAVEGSMLNDNVISGQTELASGSAVDADEIMISDGGTLKKLGLDSLKVYMSDIAAVIQNVAASGTLIVGVNYFSDMGSDGEDAVTLPASPSVGQSVKVKAPSDASAARYITINKAGSQTIDGAASIRLESPFAAVELVYVANDLWRVF